MAENRDRNPNSKREPRTRINGQIRAREVQLIGADGANLGVQPLHKARAIADQDSLDLVEISPQAKPPVCKIMDYGKFKYDQSRKERDRRKNTTKAKPVKEVKLSIRIGEGDYQTKLNRTKQFLSTGHKVKISVQLRGRENIHAELATKQVERAVADSGGKLDGEISKSGRVVSAVVRPV